MPWPIPKAPSRGCFQDREAAHYALAEAEHRGRKLRQGVDPSELVYLMAEDLAETDKAAGVQKAAARLEAAFEPIRPLVKFFVRRLAPWSAFQ